MWMDCYGLLGANYWSFKTKSQLKTLKYLHNRVQESFVDGKAPHLLGNNTSSFHIVTHNVWSTMSSAEMQAKLMAGPIIIKDGKIPLVSFDCELFSNFFFFFFWFSNL